MTIIEIILIGIGLAMDAVAVSMTNGMVYNNLKFREYIAMPLFFGIFQALMPLIGNFAGSLFADIISKYAGIVILLILGIIGGKMLKEGIEHMGAGKTDVDFGHNRQGHGRGQQSVKTQRQNQGSGRTVTKRITLNILIFQAIATSIDAFAVGVGFSAMQVNIIQAVTIIAVVTAILVTAAIIIGRRFGDLLGSRAEVFGGAILIIIGIKAVL